MAGLGAGLTEAVVVNPFEVVKVSLQANRDSFKEVLASKRCLFPTFPQLAAFCGHGRLTFFLLLLWFNFPSFAHPATVVLCTSQTNHQSGRTGTEGPE